MNFKLKMRYSVNYQGTYTSVCEDNTGEFETLEEAKKAAINFLQTMLKIIEFQISHIEKMETR